MYQLYSELDFGDRDCKSLATLLKKEYRNDTYLGSWAFHTLGGAGGQTVFGALTTGTHGGDFRLPPIADAVLAMHLVVDGGKHYWIEPESRYLLPTMAVKAQRFITLTDDQSLRELYGQNKYGGAENFEIIRDDTVFNAVLMGAGRFGIVYSIVLAAVPQYCLHQERRLMTWQEIKSQVNDPTSRLYTHTEQQDPAAYTNKFLQIVVSLTAFENFSKNLAGVTKRWNVPLVLKPDTREPAGRSERRGNIIVPYDTLINAPRFAFAGNSFPYSPDPAKPGLALPPNFLERACSNSNFIDGVIQEVINEVGKFIESNGTTIGAGLLAVTAAGGGEVVLSLIPALALILAILLAFLTAFRATSGQSRLGQVMNDVKNALLNPANPDPLARQAGILVWQMISYKAFSREQKNSDFEAISYAVMDGHDYIDQSCNFNVDSIEVFFDATDPMLIAYIDALLAFETTQELIDGKAFVGYISLRFMGRTRALIGSQQFPLTCAVEVAGLNDVDGVKELIDYAIALALDNNFKGILHWGQRNESLRSDIEERFGDSPTNPTGPLHEWRQVLSLLTDNGTLDGFSSEFTRKTGLEIVR